MDNHADNFSDEAKLDDEIEFRRLIRSLELAEKYFLYFACCTAPRQRELIAQARQALPRYNLKVVSFNKRAANLLQEITEQLANEKPDAIFVNGLEYSISKEGKGKENALITNLNLWRDAFPQRLSCPLVLWLPEYALVKIINNAPDFFSVRSGIFYFSATPERVMAQITQFSQERDWETSALSLEAKQQRLETLQKLLDEYQALPLDKRDQAMETRLLRKLAEIHGIRADYPQAVAYEQQALAIAQENGYQESEAASYNNLAELYRAQGRYERAEPLYKKALDIRERVLGAGHPDTAGSYNNLALLYESQGRYDEAEPLYKKALDIRERVLGAEHPDTASSYNNLALLYAARGHFTAAREYLEKALASFQVKLGEKHPYTITVKENLEYVKQQQWQ